MHTYSRTYRIVCTVKLCTSQVAVACTAWYIAGIALYIVAAVALVALEKLYSSGSIL